MGGRNEVKLWLELIPTVRSLGGSTVESSPLPSSSVSFPRSQTHTHPFSKYLISAIYTTCKCFSDKNGRYKSNQSCLLKSAICNGKTMPMLHCCKNLILRFENLILRFEDSARWRRRRCNDFKLAPWFLSIHSSKPQTWA